MLFLKKLINNKYQDSFLKETEIFKLLKEKIKILKKKSNIKFKKKNIIYNHKYIEMNEYLWFLVNKKKLNINDKNYIYSFYKKFSSNLKLKKIYNNKLVKIDKRETQIGSYIYLGQLVLIIKKINLYQKLNFLLKVNDLCINKYQKLNEIEFYFLKENIKNELRFLKKCF
jgi:hypothetical protein